MEKVDISYRVFDNCLEIIPKNGVQDNSIYKLTLKNIKSKEHHKVLNKKILEITTAMTPSYCSVESIKTLVDVFDISESTLFYMIRQASKEADFIYETTFGKKIPVDENSNVPYPIEKFVEVKASLLALTRAYVTGTSEAGLEGTLGKITFKNGDELKNINKLIDSLKDETAKWQDAIRGYTFDGKNSPTYALRGNYSIRATPLNIILDDYTRNGNMGLKGRVII